MGCFPRMLLRGDVVCCCVLSVVLYLLFAFYFFVMFLYSSLQASFLLILIKMFSGILCRNQEMEEYFGWLKSLLISLPCDMTWINLSLFLLYFCLFIFLIGIPQPLLSKVIFQKSGRLQQRSRFPHLHILPIRLFTWSQQGNKC